VSAIIELDAAQPERQVDLAFTPGASLLVKVVTGDGRPVEAAEISFHDAQGAALQMTEKDQSDTGGRLRVPGLAAGRGEGGASREGFETTPATIDLAVGDDRELRLVMSEIARPR